jgi:hypothetical protein
MWAANGWMLWIEAVLLLALWGVFYSFSSEKVALGWLK